MTPNKPLILLFSLVLALYSLSALAEKQEFPEVTEDGLHLVDNSRMSVVYVEPGADLAPYTRVQLLEPEVAFKKNWERNQRSRSVSKLSVSSTVNTKKIKKDLAEEFGVVFTKTLEEGGYELTDEAGADVLMIRPSIINLDINAPATHGTGRTSSYTRSAGEMTLYIELFDSETGDLIAKALDRRVDNPNDVGFYTWTTSMSNRSAAQNILQGWADILLNALNDAKNTPTGPLPEGD
jgi:hypothetical protein